MLRAWYLVPIFIFIIFVSVADAAKFECAEPPGNTKAIYSSQNKIITYYVPHNAQNCLSSMEGCIATSCLYAERVDSRYVKTPVCLDAVRLGKAKFVTIASAESNQGKYFHLGTITYRSALDQQMHTVENVVGYVHDTGCAFNGTCSRELRKKYGFSDYPRPDKLDVCTTVCPTCDDKSASSYITGKGVSRIPSNRGSIDPHSISPTSRSVFSLLNPFSYRQPQQAMSVSTGYGAQSSGGVTSGSGAQGGTTNEIPGVNASPNPGPPIATLVLQSTRAQRGKSIAVAWSTLGMRSDQKCKLSLGGSVVAEENGGSRLVTIPISISLGSAEIILRCTPITGSPVEKRASFTIE